MVWPAPTPAEDPPFPSVLRNGIQSYGSAPLGTSFRVAAVGAEPTPLPPPSSPGMRTMEFCPQNYQEFPADGPPLTCGCTVEASTPGQASVFGDKVYAGNSSLCAGRASYRDHHWPGRKDRRHPSADARGRPAIPLRAAQRDPILRERAA